MTDAVSGPTELEAFKKMSSKPFWATLSVAVGFYGAYKGLQSLMYYSMDVMSAESTVIATGSAALMVASCMKLYSINAKKPGGLTGYIYLEDNTPTADALKTASNETTVAKAAATAEAKEIGVRLEPKSPENKI